MTIRSAVPAASTSSPTSTGAAPDSPTSRPSSTPTPGTRSSRSCSRTRCAPTSSPGSTPTSPPADSRPGFGSDPSPALPRPVQSRSVPSRPGPVPVRPGPVPVPLRSGITFAPSPGPAGLFSRVAQAPAERFRTRTVRGCAGESASAMTCRVKAAPPVTAREITFVPPDIPRDQCCASRHCRGITFVPGTDLGGAFSNTHGDSRAGGSGESPAPPRIGGAEARRIFGFRRAADDPGWRDR
ncbi:exported protein of unknown function [Microbacterium sp. Nx66]|nr:exported protein of unknown function [Microbacterium sp. Nx66]